MLIYFQVTYSSLYEWHYGQASEIVSFIRYILRAAIASSPATSPVKDSAARDVDLAVFQDVSMEGLFDYGLGNVSLEEEDEDMEVLDLPNIRFH